MKGLRYQYTYFEAWWYWCLVRRSKFSKYTDHYQATAGLQQDNRIASLVSLDFEKLLFLWCFSNPDQRRPMSTVQASLYGNDYKSKTVKTKMAKILPVIQKAPTSFVNAEFNLAKIIDDITGKGSFHKNIGGPHHIPTLALGWTTLECDTWVDKKIPLSETPMTHIPENRRKHQIKAMNPQENLYW